ncbi:hydroxyacylglutathione hydrolase [Spongiibacter sp.]|uniref:hydroxyacylglutathione hydrolase n=1 Tax=Spongiibacter sp. TaxID=2024860 RepID=UPI003564CC61
MGKLSVTPIPAFNDNYIWCIAVDGEALLVDPGESAPALRHLRDAQLKLNAILITHHHWDHVGGVDDILQQHPGAKVVGPDGACPQIDQILTDGEQLQLLGIDFEVLAVPGHTLDHLAYYADKQRWLFCGDTLFSGGCGRLFEGTAGQMLASLTRLQSLPGDTAVYCAHEYTLSNLQFALKAEPNNTTLQHRYNYTKKLRERGESSLPSTIADEQAFNPFLRTAETSLRSCIARREGRNNLLQEEVFAALRAWKDNS